MNKALALFLSVSVVILGGCSTDPEPTPPKWYVSLYNVNTFQPTVGLRGVDGLIIPGDAVAYDSLRTGFANIGERSFDVIDDVGKTIHSLQRLQIDSGRTSMVIFAGDDDLGDVITLSESRTTTHTNFVNAMKQNPLSKVEVYMNGVMEGSELVAYRSQTTFTEVGIDSLVIYDNVGSRIDAAYPTAVRSTFVAHGDGRAGKRPLKIRRFDGL
jgi:hypothetical protein